MVAGEQGEIEEVEFVLDSQNVPAE